ncbi:MAG: Uncharacterised protein [Flavobacterium sp. SCGC AAA160-P02]|nr:MAG: Uncharacterised protein [Flavobacterium sp. SCGC AAA160-P02]
MTKLKQHRLLLPIAIFLLFILNIIQASKTELLPDEAYYWVYSQYMDWGFFDHPPLVAVWVTISDFFCKDELGVRFFSTISFSLLIYLLWNTLEHPRKKDFTWLFLLLLFSTALLNAYGFITTPDTPLLLFFALFLFAYKKYLTKKNTLSYLLLSLAITGMMYSKYQGILIILFVVLSNWKLVKDYKLWLVILGSLILYIPHLYWQYTHNFPSIYYHLYERASVASYKFEYTLMHLVNAIAILGFTSIVIFKAFFKGIKTNNLFHKGLNYIIIGFFLFFLAASFRGHVQAQWIAPIMFPLIFITFNYLIENTKQLKLFNYLAIVNIIIILIIRIIIANEEIIPVKLKFQGSKEWTTKAKNLTKNTDKVFINSFQNTAIYWFYTREKPHYQRNFLGRKNQFEFIPGNNKFSADSVSYFTRIFKDYSEIKIKASGKDSIFISFIDDYKSLFKITIDFVYSGELTFSTSPNESINVVVKNPYNFDIELHDLYIEIVFQNKKGNEIYSIPAKVSSSKIEALSKKNISLYFDAARIHEIKEYPNVGIGIKTSKKMDLVKVSSLHNYNIANQL